MLGILGKDETFKKCKDPSYRDLKGVCMCVCNGIYIHLWCIWIFFLVHGLSSDAIQILGIEHPIFDWISDVMIGKSSFSLMVLHSFFDYFFPSLDFFFSLSVLSVHIWFQCIICSFLFPIPHMERISCWHELLIFQALLAIWSPSVAVALRDVWWFE